SRAGRSEWSRRLGSCNWNRRGECGCRTACAARTHRATDGNAALLRGLDAERDGLHELVLFLSRKVALVTAAVVTRRQRRAMRRSGTTASVVVDQLQRLRMSVSNTQ